MFPCLASHNIADVFWRRTETPGDRSVAFALAGKRSRSSDIRLSKLSGVDSFAIWSIIPASIKAILHIIGLSADMQMAGIYARWIVARMANYQPVVDGAMNQLVANTMRLVVFAVKQKLAVGTASSALPFPAFKWSLDFHLAPKSSLYFGFIELRHEAQASARARPAITQTFPKHVNCVPAIALAIPNGSSADGADSGFKRYEPAESLTCNVFEVWVSLCGMILHVICSLAASGRGTGCYQHRRAVLRGFTGVIIAQTV